MANTKKGHLFTLKIAAYVCAVFSAGMLVGGFFAPPMGIIDPTVLTGGGIMFAFAALFFGWHAFDEGASAKIQHGSTTVEIGKSEDDED